MLGKHKARIILRYYEQTFTNFHHLIVLKSLHIHTVSHYLSLISFVVKSLKTSFFFDLLVQKLFFDKNHWFQLFSTKNDWIIALFLISITLHSLSFNDLIMSSDGEEALYFDENFIATPHQVTLPEKICFLSFFRFFFGFYFLVYWDHYSKFPGFDSLKPRKMY